MSKIEAGKMELHPEPISSEELFKSIISTASILAQQKDVRLIIEFPQIDHGGWMPVMDGITAAKAIRAIPDRKDAREIPIIAMTANAFDDDREQTRAVGMDEHLAKPIEPVLLYNTLADCLGKAAQSASNKSGNMSDSTK